MVRYLWAALLLLVSVTAASAQGSAVNIQCLTGSTPPWGNCSTTSPFPVIVTSGGGTIAAAVTIVDGGDVTQGALADTAATAGGTGSLSAKLRLMTTQLGTLNTTLGTPFQAGGSIGNTTFAVTNAGTFAVQASITPSSSSAIGITPVVSTAAEASHVLKATPGNVYSVYATNHTATAGYLVLLNSTTAPADGAITPLACALLSPNGVASLNYAPGPPGVFSTGITAVVTSASTCFTKTTGVITAFISGSVQ